MIYTYWNYKCQLSITIKREYFIARRLPIYKQMITDNTNFPYCDSCKNKIAEIFHDEGDYCVECWQNYTHPKLS